MTDDLARPPTGVDLELWAGIECTVNRVGDRFHDQLIFNGHHGRPDDLARLADLGVRRLRYPVLWERTAPNFDRPPDFTWSDQRLHLLRELGIAPIIGLVHHGNGPRGTHLLDSAFPEKLAAYAGAVAQRYPDVDDWTPINEVVTTARFAALYGHWYPHARDIRLCLRAILNQCRAIALAMRAIRAVNPRARLVQTEDLGKVSSTLPLAYQARHENERQRLALDLLSGRVVPQHPLWPHLRAAPASVAELERFIIDPTPPDIIGVNYYVTSDRFLDDRLHDYPAAMHGGNQRHRYVDVEAVRVSAGLTGHEALLRDTWARYRTPLAITEVHLGCSRDEQLRWLDEAWTGAQAARAAGADVRAVTAWAAFGAFHWDKLVTSLDGAYEPGLFDVRSNPPRPTALAHAARALGAGRKIEHPALARPGWWRRSERVLYPEPGLVHGDGQDWPAGRAPLVVTGGAGTLGRAVERLAIRRGLPCVVLTRADLDVTDQQAVKRVIGEIEPWAVVNAAAYVRVDDAEDDRERCHRENVDGAVNLAEVCQAHGVRLATFSSDLVFNGDAQRRYREGEATDPLGVYGESKARAETEVLRIQPDALVVRSAAFFGPWDQANFVSRVLEDLRAGAPVRAAQDLVVSPTYVPDLIDATLDLLADGEGGIWHLANDGEVSWADLARQVARMANLDDDMVEASPADQLGFRARRPRFSALDSERGRLMRPLNHALTAFMNDTGTGPR
jgi:dTDP-4-dehydrorhamnose reductase